MFISISNHDFNNFSNLRRAIFKIGGLTPILDNDKKKKKNSLKGEFFGENH